MLYCTCFNIFTIEYDIVYEVEYIKTIVLLHFDLHLKVNSVRLAAREIQGTAG
jgi:hypothetical protein